MWTVEAAPQAVAKPTKRSNLNAPWKREHGRAGCPARNGEA